MCVFHSPQASESRLRVVFEDAEVLFEFPAGATLADIAHWIEGVARLQESAPVAIDVIVATSARPSRYSKGVSHAR